MDMELLYSLHSMQYLMTIQQHPPSIHTCIHSSKPLTQQQQIHYSFTPEFILQILSFNNSKSTIHSHLNSFFQSSHSSTANPPFIPVLIRPISSFSNLLILPQQILRHSRANATKVIFLITDGYSNGGDPRPVAAALRNQGVEIYTLGIWQGNIRELNDMASHPKDQHCYLVHNFAEFEALARRALHEGEGNEQVNSLSTSLFTLCHSLSSLHLLYSAQ